MHEIFLDELKKLNTSFMELGVFVNDQIDLATRAFVDHDKTVAKDLVKKHSQIQDEATKIEEEALKLMALQQPVATDFRVVISILKAITDIERIGENSVSISWETIRLKGNPRSSEVEAIISEMTHNVRRMLVQVLTAYVQDDEKMAREVAARDTEIDLAYVKVRQMIIDKIEKDPQKAVASSSYFMVTRLLERIGDHIVNLASWVIYKTSGELEKLENETEVQTK
ncbi:MAG: phosphate signaling complex protein PhoU [Lactobacillus sp.]|nr:phosphate signaling complex protein PhoU [Lactobacillus sp.]